MKCCTCGNEKTPGATQQVEVVYVLEFFHRKTNAPLKLFKIGYTANHAQRIRELRSRHKFSFPFIQVHKFPGTWREEQDLHRHFEHLRVSGDYYLDVDGELADFFRKKAAKKS